jgi:2-oxoisovalerate dehydrogenase E2 component (dihydrolipoyl transacylase)
LRGATITLSNFGMIAGLFGTPIIVPPQVAILGAGRFFKRLEKEENEIIEKAYLPLSLTFDHQVITGAQAARFLKALIDCLANEG